MSEQKDTLTSDHVAALKQQNAALQKGMDAVRKDGADTDILKKCEEQLKAFGNFDAQIKVLEAQVGKIPLTNKDYLNVKANLTKAVDLAKKAYNAIKAEKTKPWTVEVNSKVSSWCSKHSETALARTVAEIKKVGLAAGGLRHIAGKCYDVHCAKASDYRLVGLADEDNKKFKFDAVYRHAKGGGKEFVDGARVSAYG